MNMTDDTQNKPRLAVNPGRPGYDRNRRGRGNFSRGETRGGRGRGGDYRTYNRRGNDSYVAGSDGRNDIPITLQSQRPYYNRDNNNDHFKTNVHVAKFDGKTLSDLNEFPDFNQCESNMGSSKNYRKSEARIHNNSTEVKSLNWNGRDQSSHFTHRGADNMTNDYRNFNRGYQNEAPLLDDRNFDNSQPRSNRGSNTVSSQGRGNGRQYQKRSFEQPRRGNIRQSNFPQNNFEEPVFPTAPSINLMSLYTNARFVSPPTMENFESMPGDSLQDLQESNFYKYRVNDDTLELSMRQVYQLEFYFSNFNLKTDSFLRDQMDPNGYVSLETVLKFPRMMRLKTTRSDLIEAINNSDKLECDSTLEMVRKVDSPGKWTNVGLFNECARVYNSYIYDESFPLWFQKAEEYMKGFPLETQKPTHSSEVPVNVPMVTVAVDPNSGKPIHPFMLPYHTSMPWPLHIDYIDQSEMSMAPIQIMPYEINQMFSNEITNSTEHYDPNAIVMFKDIGSGRVDDEVIVTDNSLNNNSLDTSNQDVSDAISGAHYDGVDKSDSRRLSENEIFMINPKEMRNLKVTAKPKPHPVKYDRHSTVQHKNAKFEAQRDVDKQVKMGLKAYEHEQNKKSTSVHGALSQHPEASSNVFVADLTKQVDTPKILKPNLPTVVDGTRIVTDKKVIQEALQKFNDGVPEPIPIDRSQPNSSVNGVKDSAENMGVRKDNKRPSGAKGRKGSGGPPGKGPTK